MSGRRTTAILASLAGAAILAATAILFLGGEPPSAQPPPQGNPVPAEPGPRIPPVDPVRKPPVVKKRPAAVLFPSEDDAPPTAEVKAVPKDRKPWARLRFLEARTRREIPFGKGRVALVLPRGTARILVPEPWHLAEDGRIELYRSEEATGLPYGVEKAEWEAAAVEIRIPGWEARPFGSRADIAGDREIELEASKSSVRGTVRLGAGLEKRRVHMELTPGDPNRDPRSPDAMPSGGATGPGPFAWFDVPDGRWRLDVWVKVSDDDMSHSMRTFDKAGEVVDLGEILLLPPTTLRARVVARDGTGVLDKDLSLHRAGMGSAETADDIDDGGWVVFRGLEADTEYRVVSTLDKLEETVRTPSEGGGDLRLELRWENEGVHCRIRFTVEGQDPIQWGDIFEGPTLDKGAWKKDGFLEHDMAAGEYLFGIFARPVGKDGPVRVYAKFTVPERPLWDATVDMKEQK